jgi:hypothetical protein
MFWGKERRGALPRRRDGNAGGGRGTETTWQDWLYSSKLVPPLHLCFLFFLFVINKKNRV